MSTLPKRSDSSYIEIEQFKDYEFTNCIAYEMARRNKEAFILIKEYFFKWIGEENPLKDIIKDQLKKDYLIDYNQIFLCMFMNGDFLSNYINNHEDENILYNDFLIYFNNIDIKSTSIKQEVLPKLSRPTLFLNNNLKVKIPYLNLNLPKDELRSYISEIKDEYDKANSTIKTPLELLDENLKNEFITIKNLPKKDIKKIYADMFYIYDYFNFKDKEYEPKRIELKEKLDRDKKETNKKWAYSPIDKKDERELLTHNYKVDKKNISKEKIVDELIELLDFNQTKINGILNIMRTFIDTMEYKKLITGGVKLY